VIRELKNLTLEPPDDIGPLDLLVIALRPSEAEVQCGGTLHKLSSLGKKVAVLDLTDGETIGSGLPDASLAAAEELGLAWRGNRHFPDGRLDNTITIRMTLASDLRRLRPAIVILPHWDDSDPERRVTCGIVEQAIHLAGIANVDDLTESHTTRATLWPALPYERPSLIVETGEHAAYARRALECYKDLSELGGALASQRATAEYHGLHARVSAAEAYVSRTPICAGTHLNLFR
jgi:LmbE family N-acetylglucosaminyl deacetylase